MFNDSNRNRLGFNETILYKEFYQAHNPVDITSFDNVFIETDVVNGMIFNGRRTGIIIEFYNAGFAGI